MKIGLQTWGSEGDVRPFLALAGGLAKAGHEVILSISDVSRAGYDSYADSLGIEIRTVDRQRVINVLKRIRHLRQSS